MPHNIARQHPASGVSMARERMCKNKIEMDAGFKLHIVAIQIALHSKDATATDVNSLTL